MKGQTGRPLRITVTSTLTLQSCIGLFFIASFTSLCTNCLGQQRDGCIREHSTLSYHITSWVCKMTGPSVWQQSSPYHLWLCQQSLLCPALELWELCLTPLCLCRPLWSGAQGGRDARPTVNIIHSLCRVKVVVGSGEW